MCITKTKISSSSFSSSSVTNSLPKSERIHRHGIPTLELRQILLWCYEIIFGCINFTTAEFLMWRATGTIRSHPCNLYTVCQHRLFITSGFYLSVKYNIFTCVFRWITGQCCCQGLETQGRWQGQGAKLQKQGRGLQNWSSRILEDNNTVNVRIF